MRRASWWRAPRRIGTDTKAASCVTFSFTALRWRRWWEFSYFYRPTFFPSRTWWSDDREERSDGVMEWWRENPAVDFSLLQYSITPFLHFARRVGGFNFP